MKKAKRTICALVSLAMTANLIVVMTANANYDSRKGEELSEILDGYKKIEDPIALDIWQEFPLENGAEFYVNDKSSIMITCPQPNYIGIELSKDVDVETFESFVGKVCPEAFISKAKEPVLSPDTNYYEIRGKRFESNVTLEQARKIYTEFGKNVKEFKFHYNIFSIGKPQYASLRNDDDGYYINDFTVYSDKDDNKEKIQNFITDNQINCHIEIREYGGIDVVPDDDIDYLEEIAISSQIYRATGLRGNGIMNTSSQLGTKGDEVDLVNSVQGDANCDNITDISDAVLIMQSISNPDKYRITSQGQYNADNDNDGITNTDALIIQKRLLKIL